MKCQYEVKGKRTCQFKGKFTVHGKSYCAMHNTINQISNGCKGNQRTLCGRNGCKMCFNRSFASHTKSKCWDYMMNGDDPQYVFLGSNKKCWFICDKCNHSFSARISNISKGQWCPFCKGNHKLCNDQECEMCFKRSFASHPKSTCWNYQLNKKRPRDVFLNSHNSYWLKCEKCDRSFEITLNHLNMSCICSRH